MNSGKFVSVELGSTQKSAAKTPTKTYIPLETPAVTAGQSPKSAATASNNPPETNQVTAKTQRVFMGSSCNGVFSEFSGVFWVCISGVFSFGVFWETSASSSQISCGISS